MNIKEIIDTFYGEGNRILIEATNALLVGVSHSTEKGMRLKKLGFINTKCVKEAEVEMTKLTQAEDLVSAINHFGVKYPNYKFITEKSVENICSKYGLVLLEINRLISDVPDKNLKEIEDFINTKKSDKVIDFKIEHRASKEQDDMSSKLLDEFLNGGGF